jgi:DNA-binding LacI/PurR family transcriptional regulator
MPRKSIHSKVTIKDVANKAGVSTATVSRVINNTGYASAESRRKVETSISIMGYTHNTLARSLVTKRTHLIALIIDNISNPFYPQFTLGVEETAEKNGYSVILCNIGSDAEKERNYVKHLTGLQVDGMIFVVSKIRENIYGKQIAINIPVVCLDRQIYIPNSDQVVLDQFWGAYYITKHLIDKGHKRIAHIMGPRDYLTAQDRKEGYSKALEENDIRVIQRLIVEGDYTTEYGKIAMNQLLNLENKPTAVFAANDLMAIGAMDAIRKKGFRIPEDIAVAGFDDIPFAALYTPSLTTVSQPTLQMGSLAMQMLIERIKGTASLETREVIFRPAIVVREST